MLDSKLLTGTDMLPIDLDFRGRRWVAEVERGTKGVAQTESFPYVQAELNRS